MSRRTIGWGAISASILSMALTPSMADAGGTGGIAAPERPTVSVSVCIAYPPETCARGSRLQITGRNLAATRAVLFVGTRSTRDDRRAIPQTSNSNADQVLEVVVPDGARSGPVRLVASDGERITVVPKLIIRGRAPVAADSGELTAEPRETGGGPGTDRALSSADAVFPIQGRYDFGRSAANMFGGGRGHQGHDIFASCGTPLVAARAGKVTRAMFERRAGNFVVLTSSDGQSTVYMHMSKIPRVRQGDVVEAGQRLGEVGQSGRASGCHLHFELWTAPGWYAGGKPINPLANLTAWGARVRRVSPAAIRSGD